jgi:protein PhnA
MSLPSCPKCNSEFVYQDQSLLICPECAHEWNPLENLDEEELFIVKDSNGTELSEGDKVTMIKDLKIKGSSQVIKVGTKAIIRRIVEGKDHQLDCKVDGAGEMMVTAKFVKKAQINNI